MKAQNHLKWLFPLLVTSLLASVFGVLGVVAFVHGVAGALAEDEAKIVGDTAPSILAIESGTVAANDLEMHLRDRLRGAKDEEGAIPGWRSTLNDSIERYMALPLDPGEDIVRDDLLRSKKRFDHIADRIAAAPPRPRPPADEALRSELDQATAELESALLRASAFNVEGQLRTREDLDSVRSGLLPRVLALEIASVIAAGLALLAAYQVVRGAASTSEASRQALERRATELDAFSGRVAHDLLAPLQGVIIALGLGARRLTASHDEALRNTLTRAEASLGRVRQMCADLLEFARSGGADVAAETEASQVLREVVEDLEPIAEQAGVDVSLATETNRRVRCTAGVLSSIASNLIRNAIEHGAGAEAAHVDIHAADAGPFVRVDVEDTGPGIPADEQATVFDPYVRGTGARPGGLGLGLATVRRLVEARGGTVGLSSEPGHGAHFWFTLPASS